MKKSLCLLAVTAVLTLCSTANANITSAWWHDDGDGAMVCTNWGFSGGGTPSGTLNMQGIQTTVGAAVGAHMLGWVDTTDTSDPTLTLGNSVNNDSGIAWLGYQVNVVMSIPFTFTAPGPTVDNPPTSDWYFDHLLSPTLQVGGPYSGLYEGSLFFNAGTAVGLGGELDYLYSIHFSGATHYLVTQESFAYMTMVPEPSAIVLVGMGGLMLALRVRRNSRKGA